MCALQVIIVEKRLFSTVSGLQVIVDPGINNKITEITVKYVIITSFLNVID